jgi:hypothetical protein
LNPEEFGRIPAWGYGTVIESIALQLPVGTQVFGILPLGTLPLDMKIEISPLVPNHFSEISLHRKSIMDLYNQYTFYPPLSSPKTPEEKRSQACDALFQVFFTTSWLINRFAFPSSPSESMPLDE